MGLVDCKTLREAALEVVRASHPYHTPHGPVQRWWMVPEGAARGLCEALGVKSMGEVEVRAQEMESWR